MLGQALLIALLAATPAAEPQATAGETPRSASELRAAVHDLLRQHATTSGVAQDAALVDLAVLYRELDTSRVFSDRAKRELSALVRGRLRRASDELQKQLKDASPAEQNAVPAERAPAQQVAIPPERQAVLAQIAGNPGVPPAPCAQRRQTSIAAPRPPPGRAVRPSLRPPSAMPGRWST